MPWKVGENLILPKNDLGKRLAEPFAQILAMNGHRATVDFPYSIP